MELTLDISKLTIDDIAARITLGLILEVSAYPKPGNVHRLRDFPDTRFEDFLISGVISYRYIRQAILRGRRRVPSRVLYGDLIYNAVNKSMNIHGGGNTHLGSLLMLVPIAVAIGYNIKTGLKKLDIKALLNLASKYVELYSTIDDAIYLYKAVRVVKPSYITNKDKTGEYPSVYTKDYRKVLKERKIKFWDALLASRNRDVIASEITSGYPLTYEVVEYIRDKLSRGIDWNAVIVDAFLYVLSKGVDTMVIRKFGDDIMREVSLKAHEVLEAGGVESELGMKKAVELDDELFSRGINPGSTADIIAAAISLYSLLVKRSIIRR